MKTNRPCLEPAKPTMVFLSHQSHRHSYSPVIRLRRVLQRIKAAGFWPVLLAVAVLMLWRSAIFLFWEESHFDANQAVIGLMAKHVAELRAFPLFMYGQNYMLAVEAWLAAPLLAVAGASVTALKLPLFAMHVLSAFLLLRGLTREALLSPVAAGLAMLFFAVPGPGPTAKLLEASGGIFEPLLYVLLLWSTWRRPTWCGLILGTGLLHREFTTYGFVALLVIAALRRSLFTRDGLARLAVMIAAASAV
jgi:hypothetical protein